MSKNYNEVAPVWDALLSSLESEIRNHLQLSQTTKSISQHQLRTAPGMFLNPNGTGDPGWAVPGTARDGVTPGYPLTW